MEKNEVNIYLEQLYYSAEGQDLDYITEYINDLLIDAKHLDKIDVSKVAPADWPFSLEITYLREDEVKDELSQAEVLENATQSQDDYVKYIKVV